jgi:hypothetical protein
MIYKYRKKKINKYNKKYSRKTKFWINNANIGRPVNWKWSWKLNKQKRNGLWIDFHWKLIGKGWLSKQ